ncbi:hypothetical protein KC865_02880 [Candidatus Kaiserbacteria bacterium]|nr:hypothetical protein [Candidatus Kaiserbacteria bacterium]
MNQALTSEEVLEVLGEGGSLKYFFLDGGVAVMLPDGSPKPECYCPIEVFLQLRSNGTIQATEKNVTGYPYFANNHRSDVYRIATT